ncbi:MAG TPA: hypothetical protein VEY33_05380 [Gemmatimonadota bacterium]|nr:hypothetical protein [Gemmatimonadota bacterium]
MNRINWGRVIVGGLAAGVVLNLGEWLLHEVVLRERMQEAVSAMGMELPSGSDIGIFVAMTFVLGILLVWLYAAIRPRYGPGPKAAIVSGLVGWILLYAFWFAYNLAWEIFPQDMVTISTIWGFFELPIGTMVGAWLYKEEGTAMGRGAA